jgi:hypothetical protein
MSLHNSSFLLDITITTSNMFLLHNFIFKTNYKIFIEAYLFQSVLLFHFLVKYCGTKGTTNKGKRFLAQVKGCLLCRPEVHILTTFLSNMFLHFNVIIFKILTCKITCDEDCWHKTICNS